MTRINIFDVAITNKSVVVPVDSAVLAVEFYAPSFKKNFDFSSRSTNLLRFDLHTCSKFFASSIYEANGDFSVLDSAFHAGDVIDLTSLYAGFPLLPPGETLAARLMVLEHIKQTECNCEH